MKNLRVVERNLRVRPDLINSRTHASVVISSQLWAKRLRQPTMEGLGLQSLRAVKGVTSTALKWLLGLELLSVPTQPIWLVLLSLKVGPLRARKARTSVYHSE